MPLPGREIFVSARPLCIRLPLLRGPLPGELDAAAAGMPEAPGALRLWPGHRPPGGEVPAGWHAPGGYPFSHAEAAALLAAFGKLDARDLAGARDAADRAQQERRARELGEMANLAAFAENRAEDAGSRHVADAPVPARIAAEQAQKLLLWLWLQEERLAELASLAAGCARGLSRLARGFGEEGPDTPVVEPGAGEPALALHPGLIPPWRPAVASAVLFVAGDAVFFVEGPMREELLDSLDFRPAPEWGERLGCAPEDSARVVAAEAPLWRALGRQRPPVPEGPAELRVWITWGRP